MNKCRPILNNKGLTLIELMIVLVLSLLLMAAVYLTYQLQHASGQSQAQVVATQQDLRAAMDIISVDIMNSGYNPIYPTSQQQIQGIANTSGASSLELVMDLNGNGATNGVSDVGEDVIYNLPGNLQRRSLTRTCSNPGGNIIQVIANNVTQLSFTYLDQYYNIITPSGPGNTLTNTQVQQLVKFIRVTIIKQSDQKDPQTHNYLTRELERTVCIRNGWING